MNKIKVGVLHGAIKNSGDFLIFNRGLQLLNEFLDPNEVELVPIERWNPFGGIYDTLVLLGGPIISRTLHPQAQNIREYLKKFDVPIICIGLGVSGNGFGDYTNFFQDEDTIIFWKHVYDSSKLFSVRDRETQLVLSKYNINAKLTGCPAFFDIDFIKSNHLQDNTCRSAEVKEFVKRILVTIPNLNLKNPLNLICSIFLISYIKLNLKKRGLGNEIVLLFQHGVESACNRILANFAKMIGFKVLDASGIGLDKIKIVKDSDLHIGTRLHANIFFISKGKPSYLFNVDNRTQGFLSTISVPSANFSILGIYKLVNMCFDEINNREIIKNRTDSTNSMVLSYYSEMTNYLYQVRKFVE